MKNILCIGSVTADLILSPVDKMPAAGTLMAVDKMMIIPGGCASNTAVDIAKLGGNAALCCMVGHDSFGDMVLSSFAADGVDVTHTVRGNEPTTTSVVCVSSSGERSFIYYPGSTSHFKSENIPLAAVENADIIFVGGIQLATDFIGEPCAEFFAWCRRMGKYTVLDTAWDFRGRWMTDIEPVLEHVDLFMPSASEAEMLAKSGDYDVMTDTFMRLGAKNVIIKAGADGAYICEKGKKRYMLPTYREIKPIDTTGAGDSFCAGFLYGLADGLAYRQCGEIANAVGTHCIMQIGATAGIPDIAHIREFMRTHTVK